MGMCLDYLNSVIPQKLSQNILIVIFVSVHLHQFLPIKKLNGECCCLDLVSSCCLNCCIDDWLYWDGDRRTYCQLDDKWAGYTGLYRDK